MTVNALLNWVRSEGGKFSVSVERSQGDNAGRILVASEDIVPDGLILFIPSKLVFCVDRISDRLRNILEIIPETILQRSEATDLILFLIYERNRPHSFWKPFLDAQPTEFTSPLLQTSARKLLRGSPLSNVVEQLRYELLETYNSVFPWLNLKYFS